MALPVDENLVEACGGDIPHILRGLRKVALERADFFHATFQHTLAQMLERLAEGLVEPITEWYWNSEIDDCEDWLEEDA